MFFSSKKDWWMTIIIWLCVILFIVPPLFSLEIGVWMTPESLRKQWIKFIILFPLGFCLMWIWFKTGYTIEDNVLKIQYGPFKKKIKIDDIHRMKETKNLFTAPALSMDKIEIKYARFETVSISPKNKMEFVRQLLKKNPMIKTDSHVDKMKGSE